MGKEGVKRGEAGGEGGELRYARKGNFASCISSLAELNSSSVEQ